MTVTAGAGHVTATIRIDPATRPGVVSLPHGFDDPNIGELTTDTSAVHPDYGMPALTGLSVVLHPRPAR